MRTDIDHIDALVKGADPVDPLSLSGPESQEADRIWERVKAATSLGTDAPPFCRPRPRRARRLVLPAVGVGTVAAVIILVLQLLPSPALQSPSAAAAVLGHLAGEAADAEPVPILKGDQWLESEFRVSYLLAPPYSGHVSAALGSARAVVAVNAEVWANDLTQTCSQQVVTSIAYNSLASQQAWSSSGIGLPATPQPQCGSGALGEGSQAPGVLDVAQLPTDPATLAQALETGTTGISALDQPTVLRSHNYLTPFGRAVMLLVGPTLGATPALWSALFRAMAVMPGVDLIGTEPTHSGATGVALSGATGLATGEGDRATIILSPSTGALLEARNVWVTSLLEGTRFGVLAIQWLDPAGLPQVVDSTMLPSSLAGKVPTGIVSAVTNRGVPLDRWDAWLGSVLLSEFPTASGGAGATSTPGVYDVSVVTFTPNPDVARIKRLFQASDLVHEIRSATG
jgi:hypothetical protein